MTKEQAHQYKLGLDMIVFGGMVVALIETSPHRDVVIKHFTRTIAKIVKTMSQSDAPERRQMGRDLELLASHAFHTSGITDTH